MPLGMMQQHVFLNLILCPATQSFYRLTLFSNCCTPTVTNLCQISKHKQLQTLYLSPAPSLGPQTQVFQQTPYSSSAEACNQVGLFLPTGKFYSLQRQRPSSSFHFLYQEMYSSSFPILPALRVAAAEAFDCFGPCVFLLVANTPTMLY